MHSIATEYDWSAGQPKTWKRTTVDPHVLEKLDGTYELSPKFLINILKVGDRLFAQATGQDRYEIFPTSDRGFFFTAVDAVLTFDVENSVRATRLILHQNGVDRVAKRIQ